LWLKTPYLLRSTTICQFIVCHKALQINLKLKRLKDERNSSRFLWGRQVYGEVSMHVRSPCVCRKFVYLHCDVDCEIPKYCITLQLLTRTAQTESWIFLTLTHSLVQTNFTSPNALSFLKKEIRTRVALLFSMWTYSITNLMHISFIL
jgi:hypothetical protein